MNRLMCFQQSTFCEINMIRKIFILWAALLSCLIAAQASAASPGKAVITGMAASGATPATAIFTAPASHGS
jgi:hypothetical protein